MLKTASSEKDRRTYTAKSKRNPIDDSYSLNTRSQGIKLCRAAWRACPHWRRWSRLEGTLSSWGVRFNRALCLFIGRFHHLSNGMSHGKNRPEQNTSWAGAGSQAVTLHPCPLSPAQGAPVLTAQEGTWLVWTAAPSSSPALATDASQPRAARESPRRSRQLQHVERRPAGSQDRAPRAHLCPPLGPPGVLGGQRPPACRRTGLPADAAAATPPAPGYSPRKGEHLLPSSRDLRVHSSPAPCRPSP